jgi:L-seryl-tRNA(Ser) seleniumtransferase
VGKLTLAALEPVLALYRAPERLGERLPTLRLLMRATAAIEAQARRLMPQVQAALGAEYTVSVAPAATQIGSGAMPIDLLASYALCVRKVPGQRATLEALEVALRDVPRPIIGRIAEKTLWLDLRCLDMNDEAEFLAQWNSLNR